METGMPGMLPWQSDVLRRAQSLKHAQHLPHAVLLKSDSEQRMEQFARYLSMLLLCDAPAELSPCGACEACRMMAAGTYADFGLVTLEPDEKSKKMSKNIKIEQIRELIHELNLTRKYERLKIAVIFPAESMSKAGANALLKTLEEPAPGVLLVLLTRHPGRVPVTLRSRCQAWAVHPPADDLAMSWLREQGLDEQGGAQYLQYADGDPLLALQLHEQDFAGRVEGFRSGFAGFLRDAQSVSELCKQLLSAETATARRLIEMTLGAYCRQACGADAGSGRPPPGKQRARLLLDLQQRAQRQLQVEENNLDFQLQLEDVLISLKQILTRRSN